MWYAVSFGYSISVPVIEWTVIRLGYAAKITIDVVEEMTDVTIAKDVVRNVFTNIALVSALLLTMVIGMLQVDQPECDDCDPDGILQAIYVTSTWTSILSFARVTVECVVNLVYTEGLPHYMVLRYLISFPGSIGGPVIALTGGILSMMVATGMWIAIVYDRAAGIAFGVICIYYVTFASMGVRFKSAFSGTRDSAGAETWQWVEDENAKQASISAFPFSKATEMMLRERGQQALRLESIAATGACLHFRVSLVPSLSLPLSVFSLSLSVSLSLSLPLPPPPPPPMTSRVLALLPMSSTGRGR
jgi:hypothetical protein